MFMCECGYEEEKMQLHTCVYIACTYIYIEGRPLILNLFGMVIAVFPGI